MRRNAIHPLCRPHAKLQLKNHLTEERKIVMKKLLSLIFTAALVCAASATHAQKDPMVGGAAMFPSKNIVENALNSNDHTTLVAAVKAAGLVETLEGPGPFTVFAPTNEAFSKLPAGTVDNLLKPENLDMLKKVLTYHVVSGSITTHDLKKMIADGGGKATLTTVEGGSLWVSWKDGKFWIKDDKGNLASITIPNVYQSNGVIQVIDTVLMP
jgi:uncharacterized surface protein with fasciclin (FAS1) repeats